MTSRVIVTGAAGFIGSQLARALTVDGFSVVASDFLTDDERWQNLNAAGVDELVKPDLLASLIERDAFGPLDAISHQGACSDTTNRDGPFMMARNYDASIDLVTAALSTSTPFVYASSASVYGNSPTSVEGSADEQPLNLYAFSKLQFDRYVRARVLGSNSTPVVGLRYFNVYGEREIFKGRMASVIHHFRRQIQESGSVKLFDASGGYEAGEQRRDFVYVEDVIAVNRHFCLSSGRGRSSGIVNVGTGTARTFNDVARLVIAELGGSIEYIPFPADLVGRYQHFTQANLHGLHGAGFPTDHVFTPIEVAVPRVVRWLEEQHGH